MKQEHISLELARKIVINTQLLDSRINMPSNKEGVTCIIDRLGYIQIDTIAVINRAHHHTLWTRLPDYENDLLHELQATDRRIYEYWGHAMSYFPIADYRFSIPRMRNFYNPKTKWGTYMHEKGSAMMEPVLERIRKEGPLGAKDFSRPAGTKQGTWWDWKPAKAALELLFWRGDLMITERRNFQKVYDLTERVLPQEIDTTFPDEDELGHFFVRRALTAYGVAHEREIQTFMQPESERDFDIMAAGRAVISKVLNKLVESGDVSALTIETQNNTGYYALKETIKNFASDKQQQYPVMLLSPFDNFIIQRNRLKRLFNFDYALECYLPEAKRTYGYFVLPILWRDQFVGRLDPKADRKRKTLVINNLVFEENFVNYDEFLEPFVKKLAEFARFNECEKIVFKKVTPVQLKAVIERLMKKKS